jgi:hypothetical protein
VVPLFPLDADRSHRAPDNQSHTATHARLGAQALVFRGGDALPAPMSTAIHLTVRLLGPALLTHREASPGLLHCSGKGRPWVLWSFPQELVIRAPDVLVMLCPVFGDAVYLSVLLWCVQAPGTHREFPHLP